MSGEGQLIKVSSTEATTELELDPEYKKARDMINLTKIGTGLLIAATFFTLGALINKLAPAIHGYAWMILSGLWLNSWVFCPRSLKSAAINGFSL